MTTTINASTSSGLVVTPDNSGNVLLQYNGVSTPVFRAYATAGTSIPNSTFTTIIFDTKSFDTANYFNTSTSRFTPLIAGYYQLNAGVSTSTTAGATNNTPGAFFKNGVWYSVGSGFYQASGGYIYYSCADLIYFNGSTDYVDFRVHQATGSTLTSQSNNANFFSGFLVRGA